MGNESSLPADGSSGGGVNNEGSEVADQGRSPTSPTTSGNPQQQVPHHQQSSTPPSPSHPNQSHERRSSGQRPGVRMIGAVFGKGARTMAGAGGGGGHHQQQNHHGVSSVAASPHDLEDREKGVRPSGNLYSESTPAAHGSSSGGLVATNSYYDTMPTHPYANTNGGDDVVTSHDYFAQAQQQNYYSAQQQQQMNQHQQQTPHPVQYYGAQPQPVYQSQPHQLSFERSTSSHDVNQREHPAVGVMYERPPNPTAQQKKTTFPGRATARGAALISSMRNLTLTGALRGGGGKKEVNDWEKQWDADEDDDSDEEDEDQSAAAKLSAGAGMGPGRVTNDSADTTPLHHSQVRPAMDLGHSELPMQPIPQGSPMVAPFEGDQVSNESLMTNFNNGSNKVSYAAADISTSTQQHQQQQQDLAAEWDMAGIQPPTAIVADQETTATAAAPQQQQETVKPNVQMFLPMLRVLGKGSFGKVVLVQKRFGKERGALFAMKILRKTHLVKRRQIERTRTERRVLSVVNHPFIMKLHYAFQSHDKLYLVLDYCPGGELFFHLSRFRRFPERVARFYAAELLLAIGHLHKRGIIYRDLKPENVLLDADGHVKLGDFGLAKAGIKHPCEGATSMCGTPEYMAPEVLAQAGHGFCVDYWGLGMLLYEMMTGLPPWYTTDRAKLFRRLKSAPLDIPSYFSEPAANCVSALLERNPRRRLGVTGIRNSMEHEFFRNISWKSLYARRVEAPVRPCEGWRLPETSTVNGDDDRIVASNAGPMSLSDIEGINRNDLDAATANFDNTFTRMPVESEEMTAEGEGLDEAEAAEQLNDETFLGFSFDSKDRELQQSSTSSSSSSSALSNSSSHSARSWTHMTVPSSTAPSLPPLHTVE